MDIHSLKSLGSSSVTIYLYVEDADALANRTVAAGAKMLSPIEDKFYGDRGGKLADPLDRFGTSQHARRTCRQRKFRDVLLCCSADSEGCVRD